MSWILCTEKLPEMEEAGELLKKIGIEKRSKECLLSLTDKDNGTKITISKAFLQDGKWHSDSLKWLNASRCNYEIVAWQYLPEPY